MEVTPELQEVIDKHKGNVTTAGTGDASPEKQAGADENVEHESDDDVDSTAANQSDDEGWEEYAQTKGIKGKSFDEAMDDYSLYLNGTHPSLQKEEAKPNRGQQEELSQEELLLPESPFQKHIAQLIESGNMDAESGAHWKTIGAKIDAAYAPVFNKLNQFMKEVSVGYFHLFDSIRSSEWAALPNEYRSIATRGEIDALMQSQKFPNYRTAITYYASTKKPDAVQKLLAKAKEEGIREAEKKKFAFSKSMQRGNGNAKPSEKLSDYITRDGTYDLNRLSKAVGSREKAMDMVRKEAEREIRGR